MNDYILKAMDIENIEDVMEIESLSFRTPWSREAFVFELTRNKCSRYRVLMIGERVVAYGGMWVMLDEAHITNVAVHPDYRGMKYGDAILKDLIEAARYENINAMTLEVRKTNTVALNLYKKYGFVEVAERKGYYQDTGEDAIIMWKYDVL